MVTQDTTLFIHKVFQDKTFNKLYVEAECIDFNDVVNFAKKHNFIIDKEQLISIYKKNYKMRWMMYQGKKIIATSKG